MYTYDKFDIYNSNLQNRQPKAKEQPPTQPSKHPHEWGSKKTQAFCSKQNPTNRGRNLHNTGQQPKQTTTEKNKARVKGRRKEKERGLRAVTSFFSSNLMTESFLYC